jgi:hypothetical protein
MLHRIGMIAGPIIAGFASDALTVAIPLLVAFCCALYLPAAITMR